MKMRFALLVIAFIAMMGCDEHNNFIVFSVQDDIALGKQVSEEISKDPNIRLLSPEKFPLVYEYLYAMRNEILNSGELAYAKEFEWNIYVVDNMQVRNAFATPGGNIYIYTGLIQYLDHADDLAGVLGHEMAHADQRHTVRNLQRIYGVDILLNVIIGQDVSVLKQMAGQVAGTLAGLQFSREFETEADRESVHYLSHTRYACNGAAYFFVKLNEASASSPPEFLSTHPNPENRIDNINSTADDLGCSTSPVSSTEYQEVKNSVFKG